MDCPECGHKLAVITQTRQKVYYCDNCGYTKVEQANQQVEIPPEGKVCKNCKTVNRENANFCRNCGTALN